MNFADSLHNCPETPQLIVSKIKRSHLLLKGVVLIDITRANLKITDAIFIARLYDSVCPWSVRSRVLEDIREVN